MRPLKPDCIQYYNKWMITLTVISLDNLKRSFDRFAKKSPQCCSKIISKIRWLLGRPEALFEFRFKFIKFSVGNFFFSLTDCAFKVLKQIFLQKSRIFFNRAILSHVKTWSSFLWKPFTRFFHDLRLTPLFGKKLTWAIHLNTCRLNF